LRRIPRSVEGTQQAARIGNTLQTTFILADADATAALAEAIAPHLGAGDFLGLSGGLGAGKSFFARALISARLAALGRVEEIPSPSFTLVQVYDLDSAELWHADLFRLDAPEEITELALDDAFRDAITVVEWAERLGPAAPRRGLWLTLDFVPGSEQARRGTLRADGSGWEWLGEALANGRAA
jgi:tRNA threonylcarbamoyladenosine biosynthesis protein TsaE